MSKRDNVKDFFTELTTTVKLKTGKDSIKLIDCATEIRNVNPNQSGYFVENSVLSTELGIKGVTHLIISQEVETISSNAYDSFSSIEDITFLGGKIIEQYAFRGCTNLGKNTTADKPFKFSKNLTSIGQGAFESCSKLKYIEFPDSLQNVGVGAFGASGWFNLIDDRTIVYAGNVCYIYKTKETEDKTSLTGKIELKAGLKGITLGCFSRCTEITEVVIQSADIGCSINAYAFEKCSKLESIYVSKLRSADTGAFVSTKLRDCYFMNTSDVPMVGMNVFPNNGHGIKLHVAKGMTEAWQNAGWINFTIVEEE